MGLVLGFLGRACRVISMLKNKGLMGFGEI
jgi:hypothetical protein